MSSSLLSWDEWLSLSLNRSSLLISDPFESTEIEKSELLFVNVKKKLLQPNKHNATCQSAHMQKLYMNFKQESLF